MRSLLAFKLGAWVGIAIAAAFVKRAVPSRGDEESDELALVAVFDGIDLKSRAGAFRGGSMLAWFGGIAVDLREAQLAPGARLSVRTFCGGVAIRTPPDWRIEADVTAIGGGTNVRGSEAADAPLLTIDGLAVLGGVAVEASAYPSNSNAAQAGQ
jgi:hypothetical protein